MNSSKRWLLPDGVDELLPSQAHKLERERRTALDLFVASGFEQIQPPLIEFTDSLLIGLGKDVAEQSMRLTDQLSGRAMALRADVSSQAARIDAHSMHCEGINRLCYIEPVVHARPRTPWSSRCPQMAGAEVFGSDALAVDIEVILLMLNVLRAVEQCCDSSERLDLTLDLGHAEVSRAVFDALKSKGCRDDEVSAIEDALQRKSISDLNILLEQSVADEQLCGLIRQLPALCGGGEVLDRARSVLTPLDASVGPALDQLAQTVEVVSSCFPEINIYCDIAEARGYEYHTGLVFAVYSSASGAALANGGRYDGVGDVFGRCRPATGFNTDLKALRRLLESRTSKNAPQQFAAAGGKRTAIAALTPALTELHSVKSLWDEVAKLRAAGEVVIFVDEPELGDYSRHLQLVKGRWQTSEQ